MDTNLERFTDGVLYALAIRFANEDRHHTWENKLANIYGDDSTTDKHFAAVHYANRHTKTPQTAISRDENPYLVNWPF